jgi:ribokinase
VRQKAFHVDAVDTVGAGDCFCGALAAALAGGERIERALLWATAAAAISTTRRGAQTSMPLAGEIEEFLRRRAGGS